jgi:hypothetical protein
MRDLAARLAKLRDDADDCILISRLATEPHHRELFAKLTEHLATLVSDVERAISEISTNDGEWPQPGPS